MEKNEFPFISSPEIEKYCLAHTSESSEILKRLEERTTITGQSKMLSGRFLGRFLSLISKIVVPETILEIGTFTGYGTICLSEGLAKNGKIITLEKDESLKHISSPFWEELNLQDKIVQIFGDASFVIKDLDAQFDLIFIDAAKRQYIEYYELVMPKLKKGGIILADNTLWKGKICSDDIDKLGKGLQNFNIHVSNDDRVENILLPIDDGVNFIRKK